MTSRDPTTSKVACVRCQFCSVLGREDAKPGAKRKRTTRTKYFETFRVQQYKQHHSRQHSEAWQEYQALSQEEKKTYFVHDHVKVANTLAMHMDGESPYAFLINRDIVEVVVGDLLFDPDDDEEELTRERALALFKLQDAEGDAEDKYAYSVIVKSSRLFRMAIKFIACGSTFRMTARLLHEVRTETGLGYLSGISEGKVSQFIRVAVAANLQKLCEILQDVWAFSIALDAGHSAGTSYFDIRFRFCTDGFTIQNLHFLALPIRDRKTSQNLFDMASTALDAVVPKWRAKLIAISTDGEPAMTGRLNGLATLFQRAVDGDDMIRIWCGLHQLDLIVQAAYRKLYNNDFIELLTGLIGYLRRQQNLITQMGTTCQKLMLTRWAHMHRALQWFVENRVDVMQYLAAKKPGCSPPRPWYVHCISPLNSLYWSL